MPFEKGNKLGNRFTSSSQPRKSGRKKDLVAKMEGDKPYSNGDIVLLLSRQLRLSAEELLAAAGKDDMRMNAGEKIAARFIADCMAKGDPRVFEVLARLNPNKTELTGKDGKDIASGVRVEIIDRREQVRSEEDGNG